MKPFAIFYIFFCSLTAIQAQVKFDISIMLDGREREFIVSVPSKAPPPDGWPLVLMLHGTSGDKEVFYNAYGWSELGQKENFVTVFPSSLRWCFTDSNIVKNNTKWVCGDLLDKICPQDTSKLIDDVKFLRRMVQLIGDTLPLNHNKIFGSGFSNGSCMIQKTAMVAGDVFLACGGSSGSFHELDSTTPQKRVPLWFMVGSLDDRYIQPPFTELPFGGDSILGYLKKPLTRTLVCQGLTSKYVKTETPEIKTYAFTECVPGEKCAPYYFSLVKDLTHNFPNGRNNPVDAPALFWDFFCNPPSTTTQTEDIHSDSKNSLICYPNPSTVATIIQIGGQQTNLQSIHVFSASGIKILSKTAKNGIIQLSKEEVGNGLFFIQGMTSKGIVPGTVLFY